VFDGPEPIIRSFDSPAEETAFVAAWIRDVIDTGAKPDEVAVFVRTDEQMARARDAVKQARQKALMLTDRPQEEADRVMVGTMHLAKGLEFKAVAVMACDDDVLPLQERIETVSDESELEEVYDTERHLLYVACTRARDQVLVTGVEPASEFLEDMKRVGDPKSL
jgi:superfamily I DNA/RNA helicase